MAISDKPPEAGKDDRIYPVGGFGIPFGFGGGGGGGGGGYVGAIGRIASLISLVQRARNASKFGQQPIEIPNLLLPTPPATSPTLASILYGQPAWAPQAQPAPERSTWNTSGLPPELQMLLQLLTGGQNGQSGPR